MNYHELRAVSVKDRFVKFDISDAPTRIRESCFVLFNRQPSPILKCLVTQSTEYKGLFEGDIVLHEGEEILVGFFNDCWCYKKRDGTLMSLTEIENPRIVSTIYTDKSWGYTPQEVRFKCGEQKFVLWEVLGAYKNKLRVSKSLQPLRPSEFQQATGCRDSTRSIYYGEYYAGFPVTLHEGVPCIIKNGEYVSLREVLRK